MFDIIPKETFSKILSCFNGIRNKHHKYSGTPSHTQSDPRFNRRANFSFDLCCYVLIIDFSFANVKCSITIGYQW